MIESAIDTHLSDRPGAETCVSIVDSAGRLAPGEVDVEVDGADLRVRPVADDSLLEEDGWLLVPASATPPSADPEFLVDTSVAVALGIADHDARPACRAVVEGDVVIVV